MTYSLMPNGRNALRITISVFVLIAYVEQVKSTCIKYVRKGIGHEIGLNILNEGLVIHVPKHTIQKTMMYE